MFLSEVKIPKTKSDLVKRINSINRLDFKVIDGVRRDNVYNTKGEIERYVGSDEVTIILLKIK